MGVYFQPPEMTLGAFYLHAWIVEEVKLIRADQAIGAFCIILVPHLDQTSESAVFGGDAARFYKLKGVNENE
jgi:hypothetical protein